MRKIGFALLLLLWVMAGVDMVYGKGGSDEERIVQVFADVGQEEQESVVEYFGVYKEDFLGLDEREAFLRQVGGELGIEGNMAVTRTYDGGRETTKLVKRAKKATTTLRFLTNQEGDEVSQYVIVNLSMEGDMENALAYRKKIEKILDKTAKDSRSSANVIGTYPGKLSLEERNAIADTLLAKVGAQVIEDNRTMQLYTIYGYTPYIPEYELQEDDAVNINIAMYYSESKDATYVYAGVPILGLDY